MSFEVACACPGAWFKRGGVRATRNSRFCDRLVLEGEKII